MMPPATVASLRIDTGEPAALSGSGSQDVPLAADEEAGWRLSYMINGETRSIPLVDTVGVGFVLLGERLRHQYQLLLVVVRPTNLGAAQWLRSLQLVLMLIAFSFVVWTSIGPLTSAFSLCGLIGHTMREGGRLGWGPYTLLLSSMPAASVLLAYQNLTPRAFGQSLATFVLMAWGAVHFRLVGDRHQFVDQVLSLRSFEVDLPRPQFPLVLRFHQEAISDTLRVRSALVRSKRYRKWQRVFTGNKWVEAILSVCLPSVLYNHQRLRMGLQLALDIVVPCFFVVQALCVFVPFLSALLSRLSRLVATDYGALLLSSTGNCVALVASKILRAMRNATVVLRVPLRCVEAMAEAAFGAAKSGMACFLRLLLPVQAFLERWIFPSDVWLLYIRTRFQPAVDLLRPLGEMLRVALEGSAFMARSVAFPLVSAAGAVTSATAVVLRPVVWACQPIVSALGYCFKVLSNRNIPSLGSIANNGARNAAAAYGKGHIIISDRSAAGNVVDGKDAAGRYLHDSKKDVLGSRGRERDAPETLGAQDKPILELGRAPPSSDQPRTQRRRGESSSFDESTDGGSVAWNPGLKRNAVVAGKEAVVTRHDDDTTRLMRLLGGLDLAWRGRLPLGSQPRPQRSFVDGAIGNKGF